MPHLARLAAAALSVAALAPVARAQTVAYTATITGVLGAVGPGRCPAPLLTAELVAPGVFVPFGAFTAIQSACVSPPAPEFTDGLFTLDFGGGHTLLGTYAGTLVPTAPPVFALLSSHVITGGTGLFAGATGGGTGTGTQDLVSGAFDVTLTGTLTAPGLAAVPEPGTVALVGGGLAGVGGAVRRRRRG
jgi:hypothetical protein